MSRDYEKLQNAVYDRFTNDTSWTLLSKKYNLDECTIRRTFKRYMQTPPLAQPISPTDISILSISKGPPFVLSQDEERLIFTALLYFAESKPLTKQDVEELLQHYILVIKFKTSKTNCVSRQKPSYT